jgi:hypothetical protein
LDDGERSHRRIRDLAAHTVFKDSAANAMGCVRISIFAGSNTPPERDRIQMSETTYLQIGHIRFATHGRSIPTCHDQNHEDITAPATKSSFASIRSRASKSSRPVADRRTCPRALCCLPLIAPQAKPRSSLRGGRGPVRPLRLRLAIFEAYISYCIGWAGWRT